MFPQIERIDHILWRFLLWSTSRLRRYMRRWWQYGYKEPPIDAQQANKSLLDLCGYKLEPSKPMRLAHCRLGVRNFRLGLYVTATPIHHKSKHWQMYWCRFVDDPYEFYLVRSALQTCHNPSTQEINVKDTQVLPMRNQYSYGDSLLDHIESKELSRLLDPPVRRVP